jgi:hypothetical protein
MRLTVILLFALVDILLAFLNHFPLGALMLRLKDANRLPGQYPTNVGSKYSQQKLLRRWHLSVPYPDKADAHNYLQAQGKGSSTYTDKNFY